MNYKHMLKTILSLVFAITLLTGALVALQAMPIDTSKNAAGNLPEFEEGISITSADDDGVSFVLNTIPVIHSPKGTLIGNGLNSAVQEPGAPELPYYSTFIVVPPKAELEIEVHSDNIKWLTDVSVNAVAEPMLAFVNTDPNSLFPETAVSQQSAAKIPNPDIYAKDSFYPNQTYRLSDPVYYRDMRLVKLDLFPVQYNPVRQRLQHSQQLRVNIQFKGAQLDILQPAPSKDDVYQSSVAGLILNFEQGKAWRSLPLAEEGPQIDNLAETAVSLPLGMDTYKIEIDQDGIYDILGSDLAAAGMNISNVDPATIQIMSRGEDVAYDFIKVGGNNAVLENEDIIRFYGEGVNGSRREKQYLTHNVYWLWADGTATSIEEENNLENISIGTPVTTFTDSITREDENYFYSTWTNEWDEDPSNNAWDDFPNEPDSWYWGYFGVGTRNFAIDLPDVVQEGEEYATYTVELMTRDAENFNNNTRSYIFDICLNSVTACIQRDWLGHRNVNIVHTTPLTTFISGTNEFTMTLLGTTGNKIYLNRITVDYLRMLKAKNDQLFFTDFEGGRAMAVQDFSVGQLEDILVWDVTDPKTPTQILLDANDDISEHNGRYTYTIGIDSSSPQSYIATTTENILTTTNKISQYIAPTTLEPSNGADWIAISHNNFLSQAYTLANHRQQPDFGEYTTHVIDVEDVFNVYGYGLPMPEAIQNYLRNALLTWSTKPSYVVLVGDGSVSPRNLPCLGGCVDGWDENAQSFVPTDLQFKDYIQGLVPSDIPMIFLVGENGGENDLVPDMAIGRLTAESTADAANIVNKIIKYEENLVEKSAGHKRVLFLADFPDDASQDFSFCFTNKNRTDPFIPSEYEKVHLCIEDYTSKADFDPVSFMEAIKDETSAPDKGATIMNYRGHGAMQRWGSPTFWNATTSSNPSAHIDDDDLKNTWANDGKPVIIVSADCLDGHFGYPGYPALSERFLRISNLAGSAAHWGSAGLGLDRHHTILLEGFYKGIFDQDLIALGDAINYAKLYYMQSQDHSESEIYSYNLQGDPATMAILPDEYSNFLPLILK